MRIKAKYLLCSSLVAVGFAPAAAKAGVVYAEALPFGSFVSPHEAERLTLTPGSSDPVNLVVEAATDGFATAPAASNFVQPAIPSLLAAQPEVTPPKIIEPRVVVPKIDNVVKTVDVAPPRIPERSLPNFDLVDVDLSGIAPVNTTVPEIEQPGLIFAADDPETPRRIEEAKQALEHQHGLDDLEGFSIETEDGEHIAGDQAGFESQISDIDLNSLDITTRFTGLNVERSLGVDAKLATENGVNALVFSGHWNYPDFIRNAEIRVFRTNDNVSGQPYRVIKLERGVPSLLSLADIDENTTELRYLLRVYGKDNKRYDETEEKMVEVPLNPDAYIQRQQTALGASEGQRFFESIEEAFEAAKTTAQIGGNVTEEKIRVDGGQIAVVGRDIPSNVNIYIDGVKVSRDEEGDFAYNTILKSGEGSVTVDVLDSDGNGVEVEKQVVVPESDLFYVALGDLTIGKNFTDGFTKNASNEEYDDEVKLDGRLALFLRGKIQGKYLIIARADTGDEDVEDIFRNIDNKDYRNLFRRIDPDKHYPVYGDDSTTTELAPSQGKLYVRLDYNDSHAMFGNFNTNIRDVDLAQIDRSLFGGRIAFHSDAVTDFGENYINIQGFAATPGTIPARDSLRGTGGSLYFLRNTDVTPGTDKIRIEIRDKDTGIVKSVRNLTIYEDYDIDYIQGRVILSSALPSFADDSHLVQAGNLAGDSVHLVATYEYTPLDVELDEASYGGRVSTWLAGGHIRLGGSAYKETVQADLEKEQYGADITVRLASDDSNGSYIKAEAAETRGIGLEQFNSADGGFDYFTNNPTGFVPGGKARAFRVESHLDLGPGNHINTYYQHRDEGFGALGQFTAEEIRQYGGELAFSLGEQLSLAVDFDETNLHDRGDIHRDLNADLFYHITPNWRFGVGGSYEQRETANGQNETERVDIGSELRWISDDDYQAYIFGQTTVDSNGTIDDNNRAGAGFIAPVSDKIRLHGEVSDGDGGLGAKAGIDYQYDDATRLYMSYDLAEQSNFGTFNNSFGNFGNEGKLAIGARHRYSDSLSVYGEERLNHRKGDITGLTHAYGVDIRPYDKWSINASFEQGEIEDIETIDRKAGALTVGYADRDASFSVTGEYRKDKTTTGGNPTTTETYLGRVSGSLDLNDSFKVQAKADAAFSEGVGQDFFKGEFIEASAGLAYRPIDNDKLNALFKYSYFYDLPTAGQTNNLGNVIDYKQKSHILSADFIYDISKYLSIGAKYGLKMGEVTSQRDTEDWDDSTVQLGVLRADLHLVSKWDAMIEGRVLQVENVDMESGAVVAIYRHIGDNLKVGAGYNFCKFDDDLTDVSLDKEGAFFNIIGKF